MAAKKKFYAVAKGKQIGIFTDWATTKKMIDGFSGAKYKGFLTREAAQEWLASGGATRSTKATAKPAKPATGPTEAIIVYTDGGSRNTGNVNGGHVKKADKAAWAYLIEQNGEQHSDSAGEFGATNNRMEIMALVEALQWLTRHVDPHVAIGIVADSQYVLNAIQKHWLAGWKRRGWQRSGGQPLANRELWQQLDHLLAKFTQLHFYWTKGHADNAGNVFVDQLLNQTMDQMTIPTAKSEETRQKSGSQKSILPESQQQSVDAIKKSLEDLEWYND
ncbi:ribonuclease H family protein [Pediococcus siamensis]|uniref:ribonuclease H family protein n=1 Tax=Pediococcus siamensis TaxID=381829 RepID=UPI0039A076DA